MTNFLTQEISTMKHIAPAAVNLHIVPWSNPMILTDIKSCTMCNTRRHLIWAACNKQNAIISSSSPLTVYDYEEIVADFYLNQNKPKHCDFVIAGATQGNDIKLALCELTCKKEDNVTGPYPTGKREYAWTQMGDTVVRWQTKANYASMIGQYSQKVFIFGWRDPNTPVIAGNAGSQSMHAFNRSTTSANVGAVSFGIRGDFELIQVKYPTTYDW